MVCVSCKAIYFYEYPIYGACKCKQGNLVEHCSRLHCAAVLRPTDRKEPSNVTVINHYSKFIKILISTSITNIFKQNSYIFIKSFKIYLYSKFILYWTDGQLDRNIPPLKYRLQRRSDSNRHHDHNLHGKRHARKRSLPPRGWTRSRMVHLHLDLSPRGISSLLHRLPDHCPHGRVK